MAEKEKDVAQQADTQEQEKAKAAEAAKAVEAVKAEPKPIVVKEKYVTVKSKITGRKFIGAGWVNLVKDKEVQVTADQKRSLEQAGAIYL